MVIAELKMTAVCWNMFLKVTTIVIFLKIINSTDLKISASSGNLRWVMGDLHYCLYTRSLVQFKFFVTQVSLQMKQFGFS